MVGPRITNDRLTLPNSTLTHSHLDTNNTDLMRTAMRHALHVRLRQRQIAMEGGAMARKRLARE